MEKVFIYDNETGEGKVRNANSSEIAIKEKIINEKQAKFDAFEAKEITRQAILNRLGLTAEEAAILLG
jgi:hypothetical protein